MRAIGMRVRASPLVQLWIAADYVGMAALGGAKLGF